MDRGTVGQGTDFGPFSLKEKAGIIKLLNGIDIEYILGTAN